MKRIRQSRRRPARRAGRRARPVAARRGEPAAARRGDSPPRARPSPAAQVYALYGLCLRSQIPLAGAARARGRRGGLSLRRRGAAFFARVRARAGPAAAGEAWFVHGALPGGGDYLRWSGLFEFAVSPSGRAIAARQLDGASPETLRAYLLGQVVSFALVRRGIEPLHGTAVVLAGGAVAFLGDSGYGKSTLGAAFLREGCPILTDDVLVVRARATRILAWPGPARIKLFPEVALRLLGRARGRPMNDLTPKRLISLDGRGRAPGPVPLSALFVLARPGQEGTGRISVRRLSARHACIELIRNTFNTMIAEPDRLARQLDLAGRLAAQVPVFALSYPRELDRLPEVVRAIRTRLAGLAG
jgi:hypothetical protein